MITPQQIEQISFSKATFGGYDMQQVDEILEPLTEDYVALYKENALLKSKMRVLVGKLEEYRKNEAAAKEATASAKRAADQMIAEAEAKCAQMMRQASASAAAAPVETRSPSADALVAVEKARVAEARKAASARITEIQNQMQQCIQALDRIKNANVAAPAPKAEAAAPAPVAAPAAPVESYDSAAVADEISQNLASMVSNPAPAAPAAHTPGDTTSRFTNLNLQFGRNYDPSHK